MNPQEAKTLVSKYNRGEATKEEQRLLENWYAIESFREMAKPEMEDYARIKAEMWQKLEGERSVTDENVVGERGRENRKESAIESGIAQKPKIRTMWPRYAAAAAIAAAVAILVILTFPNKQPETITPGSNKAILTLANGKRISLTDAKNGELADQPGITKKDGELIYTPEGNATPEGTLRNTIQTPKGGQFQIQLPDGSKIWLNAASTLTINDARTVELNGEAYFEITKDEKHPFTVKTRNQELEVLGTSFNINAYEEEKVIKTTLIEGSVRIQHKLILKPGQQAINDTEVREADEEAITDWKNGYFIFKGEDFKTAMRKIARWYDVEIVYETDTDVEPGGWISRKSDINTILHRIESTTNIHFKIDGRKITVTK
jgi:transmembrane sensor